MGLKLPAMKETDLNLDSLMLEAKEIIQKKELIEQQLRELHESLESTGVGMSEPLIDSAGFPKADLDIHAIRTSRNMAIRLRNDHRAVMADVEKVLHKIHEAKRQEKESQRTQDSTDQQSITNSSTTTTAQSSQQQQSITTPPFAIVNAVAPDSPAYQAGLRRDDKIVQFGHVNASNHEQLRALNTLMSRSENQQIRVTIIRDASDPIDLMVTPRSGWGGRGTLGCHILPL